MIRRILATVAAATLLLVLGGTAAFADTGFCAAGGAGGSSAAGVTLASTGSGIDINTWLGIGVGLVVLGVYLMVFGPGRRRRGQADTTSA